MDAFAFVRRSSRAHARVAAMFVATTVALALASACGGSKDDADSTSAGAAGAATPAAADSARVSESRSEDLTGDGRPERLTLAARGTRMDSLDVQLEIRSPDDSLLYRSTWNTRFYFQYVERDSMSDAAADTLIRGHLARVLRDSSFGTVGAGGYTSSGTGRSATDTAGLDMMRDAIRYDIATSEWRRANGVAPNAEIPSAAHDPINTLARAVPAARIETLVRELKGRRAFRFFAGGEVTYAIAWSDREQRFVTIFSCC